MPRIASSDRILPEVRWMAVLIVVVLLLAVAVLYLQPDRTAQLWAWPVRPRMTALLMGAGYGAGGYFFARVAIGNHWHRIGLGFLPVTLFTWCLGIATLLHWDRFNHGQYAFWAWAGLYAVTPFLVPALWFRNRAADSGEPEPGDVVVPQPARWAMAAAGAAILLLALVMFIRPSVVLAAWLWQLTPLTTRVIAGFFGLTGANLMVVASERRWSAVRVLIESLIIGFALLWAAVPRAWTNFDPSSPWRVAYVGGLMLGLVALGALYLGVELSRRGKASVSGQPA